MITLKKNALKYKDENNIMQDSGVLFSSGETDETLTKAGIAADAKIVGAKFEQLSNEIVENIGVGITTHNTSNISHNDIREMINGLTTRLNALADSDDTTLDQLSEIVAYIKSNKSLIDSVTTNKVNVSDIINNLTTNVSNKPLSAAQGVVIKGLIDALESALNTHKSDTTVHITSEERTKWNNASTHANSNHVTGIKGNAESSYRTGEVNITPVNIGLDKVDNTSDIDKPVSTAQRDAINSCSTEAKEFTRLNTYKSFIFQNSSVSTLADQPEVEPDAVNYKEVIAGSDEKSDNMYYHKLKFIAADNRISFSTLNSDAFNEGIIDEDEIDQVYITVNADPEGSADAALDAAKSHTNSSLENYYNKEQIDDLELITVEDIDAICGTTIIVADDEVKF